MTYFILALVLALTLVSPAIPAELRHWQALATDTYPCAAGVTQSNFQNPEPQTIYIRRIHFHVHTTYWGVINAFLTQGWDQRSSLAFHVRYDNGEVVDRWSDFTPHYVSLPQDGRIWFEYGCGGGGDGQFYMTVFYTLEP